MATRSEEFEGLVRNYSRVVASAIRRVCGRYPFGSQVSLADTAAF